MNYKQCWEIGKKSKEQFGESWESWTKDPGWEDYVKKKGFTDNQLFYFKLGVDGKPFQDTSMSDVSGDVMDDEIMPFGKHKGAKFGSLTPNYLRWINEQPWLEKWPTVAVYVKRKLDELKETKLDKDTVRQMLSLDED